MEIIRLSSVPGCALLPTSWKAILDSRGRIKWCFDERSSQQHPGYPFADFRAMCFSAYKGLHNGQTPAQRGEGRQFEAKCLSQWKEVGGRRRPEGEVDSTSSSQISPKAACVRGEQESRERRAGVLRRLRLVIFRCACAGSRRHGAFHFSDTNLS